ncbi:MAG: response regulator [Oligoflexia bacterium]|nr:response regulator [Oligoflexia bacterium]
MIDLKSPEPAKSNGLILVAEDDKAILELIDYNLKLEGFKTCLVGQGDEVFSAVQKHKPDLVLLDLMLPGEGGIEICKKMRSTESTKRIPVIMLTAKSSETDKVVGLEVGADDYVTKPFSTKELMARVKASLRRNKLINQTQKEVLQKGDLTIDLRSYKVSIGSQEIGLTLTEYKLLRELMAAQGEVLSRGDLVSIVMGPDVSVTDRTIDVHLASLRKKINPYADHIETVRGVGYRFKQ